jgi:hypothetical protein
VVPVAAKVVPGDGQGRDLHVADLDAGGIGVGVRLGVHTQPRAGGGRRDGLRDDLVAGQQSIVPVRGDVADREHGRELRKSA